ncbi:hypothetical protein HDA40_002727 [Hamadaea flava]|uniref:Heparinase II/III family protein n=1 Tax=Hamadaea flava TaxID=1742688 RepID=A0ABV8LGB1_9ACTN|nr:heparinase II/III family protein [Hamadaea flava]MCP2324220.1 hypothetical protein [Hamadaea flava]
MIDPGPLRRRLARVLDADDPDELAYAVAEPGRGIAVPDVTDRSAWDAIDPRVRQEVLAAATAALAEPAPVLSAGAWARAFRDGDRGAYEGTVRRLRERVSRLVLAAMLTGETASATAPPDACPHLDGVVDGLMALAEASTWCWAAHDRHTAARGEIVPDPDDPYLDLGAAEMASLFAWADHALGPHLDQRAPGLRRRLRREVDRRVLSPFEQVRDWPWIGLGGTANNWNPWIHGSVLAAALFLCDDRPRRAHLVRLIVSGLDHYLTALPDDGSIDEGIAYWWQGPCRLMEALDLLAEAGGDRLDARDLPILAALLRYPERMHLGGDWYVNVGDASARLSGEQPWHVPRQWAVRWGLPPTAAYAAAGGRASGQVTHPITGLGRALTALADPDWHRALADPASEPPWLVRETWFARTQVLVARESAGRPDGLTVAVKGGHNGEHHNHLDVGTYWVALDGKPVVVDVGRPTYTAATFGPRRYDAWPFQSAWHNVPDVGGGQCLGEEHGARAVVVDLEESSGGDVTELRAELGAVYPPGLLDSWRREVRLVRSDGTHPAYLEVADAWDGTADQVRLRHVLAGRVEVGDGWATVEPDPGRRLRMTWDATLAAASLDHQDLDDPLLRHSWGERVTRLTLTSLQPGVRGRIAVRWSREGSGSRRY